MATTLQKQHIQSTTTDKTNSNLKNSCYCC